MSTNCIFCKIIRGEIPCEKVYESTRSLAFMDVSPLSLGHILVIPKTHARFYHELDADDAADLAIVVNKITKVMDSTSYNILQNNGRQAHQFVDHVHMHIIPKTDDTGLGISWTSADISKEQISNLASSLRSKLE
ncbi:hypothetical protein GEMRC1_009367 [Eukaryota sp. GEM-RC1]